MSERTPSRPPDDRPAPCPQAARTITCQQCVDFLLDYVDGLMQDAQRFRFESHIAFCPECETFLRNYREAMRLTQGLARDDRAEAIEDVPEALVQAILNAHRHTHEEPPTPSS